MEIGIHFFKTWQIMCRNLSGLSFFRIIECRENICAKIHSTVFKNHRKSLIQHCECSELRLHCEWAKVPNWQNCRKMPKLKNSNATFLVIFKHCGLSYNKSLGFWLMMRCDQVCSILKIVAAQKSWRLLTAYFTEWMMILLDLPSVTLSVDDDGSTAVP